MFSRLYPIIACAFILSSAHAFAGGAACCERPASRAGYLTAKPPGKGGTSAPATKGEGDACPVSHSPAPSSSTTAQKPKTSSTLGALLGAFWVSRGDVWDKVPLGHFQLDV